MAYIEIDHRYCLLIVFASLLIQQFFIGDGLDEQEIFEVQRRIPLDYMRTCTFGDILG